MSLLAAMLLSLGGDGWGLLPLPVAEVSSFELSGAGVVGRTPARTFRYFSLWDVSLQISAWTEDDCGLFLQVLNTDGEVLATDEEGEGGPECSLEFAVPIDRMVHVRIGSVDADTGGTINLSVVEGPSWDTWRAQWRPPEPTVLAPEHQEILKKVQSQQHRMEQLFDQTDYGSAETLCFEICKNLCAIPEGHQYREVAHAAQEVLLAIFELEVLEIASGVAELAKLAADRFHPPDSSSVQISTMRLASARIRAGEFEDGRRLMSRALVLQERGKQDLASLTITRLNATAALMESRDIVDVQALFDLILEVSDKIWPPGDPNRLVSYVNLGVFRYSQGDMVGASRLLEQILPQIEESLGSDHPMFRRTLSLLAASYQALGDQPAARAVLEQSLLIGEENLPEDSVIHHDNRRILARLLAAQGEWDAALGLISKNQDALRRWMGIASSDYQLAVLQQIEVLILKGDCAQARSLLEDLIEHASPPDTALRRVVWHVIQTRLAHLHLDAGEGDEARALFEDVHERELAYTDRGHERLREIRERIAMCEVVSGTREVALSLTEQAWRDHVAWIGGLRVDSWAMERILGQSNTNRSRFLELFEGSPDRQLAVVMLHRSLASRRLREAAGAVGPETWNVRDIAASMPDGMLGLSITNVRGEIPGRPHFLRSFYLALLLSPDGSVAAFDLGDAGEIHERVRRWLDALRSNRTDEEDPSDEGSARGLVAAILPQKLKGAVASCRHLVIAADGALATIPWEALIDERRPERRAQVSFSETLACLPIIARQQHGELNGLVSVGGIDYGLDGSQEGPVSTSPIGPALGETHVRLSTPRAASAFLSPLPISAIEVRGIAELHSLHHPGESNTLYLGSRATKDTLLQSAPGSGYVHLATHGWYVSPEVASALDPDVLKSSRPLFQSEYEQVRGLSPGQLCGLAFAGANSAPAKRYGLHPGILMADEVTASLDLSKCKLAVLSACDSTVGLVRSGQNVVSLNRAFWNAGARSVVGSLWKVDDRATEELFLEFYRQLWEDGRPVGEALSAAKQHLRDHPDHPEWSHPSYWAAWVLYGATD